jgi:hypothetical protein
MKKVILLFLIIVFTSLSAYCEQKPEKQIRETYKLQGQIEYDDSPVETIYLDEDVEKPQVNIPKRILTIPAGDLNITSNAGTRRSALARAMVYRGALTDIMPLSGTVSAQAGGFSYGHIWSQELSYSQMESTTAFFLRYDFPKALSITTSIRQSANEDIGTQFNTLRFAPEWHINERLTLKDSFSSYMNLPKNKNEITLVYTPSLKKYADQLKFELGLAQSFYRNGQQSNSVSFSTGFKL